MEDRSTHTPVTNTRQRGVRALFFALTGALFGALCAADSNVTMTLIAESLANDQIQVIIDEFVRNGGGFRGGIGAIAGLFIGIWLFHLMSIPTQARTRQVREADFF